MSTLIGGGQQVAPKANHTPKANPSPGPKTSTASNPHGNFQDTMTFTSPSQSDGLSKMNCLKKWAQRHAQAKPGQHTPLTQNESICLESVDKIKDMRREQFLNTPAQKLKTEALQGRIRDLMMQ